MLITNDYRNLPQEIKTKYKYKYLALDQYSGNVRYLLSNNIYKNGREIQGFTILEEIRYKY